MKIDISKLTLFSWSTLILFIGNSLNLNILSLINDSFTIDNKWYLVLTFSLLLMPYVIKLSFYISKEKMYFIIVWELFIVSIFFSKFLYGNFNFLEFGLYSILIPLSFFSPKILKYKYVLIFSFIVSVLPFLYILGSTKNGMGILFCLSGIVLINILRNKSNKYIYLLILTTSILIYTTGSRTALLTFLIVSLIELFTIFIQKASTGIIVRRIIFSIIALPLVYLSIKYLVDLLFHKFETTGSDITSGRMEVWKDLISNRLHFFGSDVNYEAIYNLINAHNTFIQVLVDYGFISFILFLGIIVYIFYKSIRLRKIEYVFFFTSYVLIGLTENVFFMDNNIVAISVLFFAHLGYLLNEKSYENYSNAESK